MHTHCTIFTRSILTTRVLILRANMLRAVGLSLAALGMVVVASAHEPRFITIDAPGAGSGKFQGTGCFAYTDCSVLLNNSGAVTGYFLDANNVYHGFLRRPDGKFTVINAPGADTSTMVSY